MGLVNALMVLTLTEDCELHTTTETYSQVPQDEAGNDNELHDTAEEPNNVDTTATPPSPKGWISKAKLWFNTSFAEISAPTRSIMYKLWFLLALDSLADGMVPYSLTTYYMDTKFHPAKSTLGDILSASYLLGAVGAVFAGPLARKIGLINTMVFTHVPSSAAVLVFPGAPWLWMTAGLLLVRAGLNNMDQAPRAAFIAAVVKPDERTAVMGITSMLRNLAAMAGPSVTGILAANKQFWIAFVVAGVCRLAYDFGLYAMFVNMKLYQHETETKVDDLPNGHGGHRQRDEEDDLEMGSLADSGESSSSTSSTLGADEYSEVTTAAKRDRFANSALEVASSGDRLRSRSPRRSTAAD